MSYKLFIDDERFPVGEDWVITRSSVAATYVICTFGIPNYISFDHDLGGEDTSVVFIKWLIEHILDNNLALPPDFEYYVHSQNPIGKKNIESLMDSFIKFVKEN